MMNFFNIIVSLSSRDILLPINTPIRMLVIGDSIGNGTNENYPAADTDDSIQGIAGADTLYEWDGFNLTERVRDTIGANNGSQYPSMAIKFKELTGRVTHIIETATGGDGLARAAANNWTAGGNRYSPMLTKANSYLTNQGVLKFDFIKIVGGINDVRGTATQAEIDEDIPDLISRLHSDFPNTPIVFTNIYAGSLKKDATRALIANIVSTDALVFEGEDSQNWNSSTYLFDGLHMYQTANNGFGEADALLINNTVLQK